MNIIKKYFYVKRLKRLLLEKSKECVKAYEHSIEGDPDKRIIYNQVVRFENLLSKTI